MTACVLYDLARVMVVSAPGLGPITLGAAVESFRTFAQAGVQDGQTVRYSVRDGAQREVGSGVYSSTGPTLARTVRSSTNGNALVNLTANAIVAIVESSEDILSFAADQTTLFTNTERTTARNNIGAVAKAGDTMTGALAISNATISTTPTNGALTVAGGLGVTGNINCGGDVTIARTATPTTGAMFFGNTSTAYFYFTGTQFQLQGGNLIHTSSSPAKPGGGPWVDNSDARIKTVLGDYEHGLAEVLALSPKRYVFKGNDTNEPTTATKFPYENSPHYGVATEGTEYIGLIAQEVEGVMPEMVILSPGYIDGANKVTDLRTLDTGALIFALINSVKELSARLQALEGGQPT